MKRRALITGASLAPMAAFPAVVAAPFSLTLAAVFMFPVNERGRYYAGCAWLGSDGHKYGCLYASDVPIAPVEAAKLCADTRLRILASKNAA